MWSVCLSVTSRCFWGSREPKHRMGFLLTRNSTRLRKFTLIMQTMVHDPGLSGLAVLFTFISILSSHSFGGFVQR